jgi:type II secretory pathway pseudopilin PulG
MNCTTAAVGAADLAVKRKKNLRLKIFSDESGFSLIELVIMVMILGITLIPLTSLSINNIRNTGRQIEMTRGIMYAEECIEYVWSFYGDTQTAGRGYQGILDGNMSFAAGLPSNLEAGYSRSYSVSSTQTLDGVDYIDVTVTVNCPTAGIIQMTARLTDLSTS